MEYKYDLTQSHLNRKDINIFCVDYQLAILSPISGQ